MLTAVVFGGGGGSVEGIGRRYRDARDRVDLRDRRAPPPPQRPCQSKWRWKANAIPACNWRSRWGGGPTPGADKAHSAIGPLLGGAPPERPDCTHHDSHDWPIERRRPHPCQRRSQSYRVDRDLSTRAFSFNFIRKTRFSIPSIPFPCVRHWSSIVPSAPRRADETAAYAHGMGDYRQWPSRGLALGRGGRL